MEDTTLGEHANLAAFSPHIPQGCLSAIGSGMLYHPFLPIPSSICLWTFSPLFLHPHFAPIDTVVLHNPLQQLLVVHHLLCEEALPITLVQLLSPYLACPAVMALHDLANSGSASVVCYQLLSRSGRRQSHPLLQDSFSKLESP